jgi:hypothetical protein
MGRHCVWIGVLPFVLGTLILAGCGGNGGGSSSPAPQQLVSISVASSSGSIGVGATLQFTATGHFSDNSTQDQTTQVTWSSSDGTIASISSSGVATGLKPGGPVTITATKGSVSGTAMLKVTPATLVSITVTPANPSVAVGISEQFVATGKFTDGSTPNLTSSVTWASSSPAIATINSAGLASDLTQGKTTISATQGSISGSTTLTVTVLVSISVVPANPSVTAGYTQQLTAVGTFKDNSTQNLTSSVSWSSSDTTTARINSTGRASTLQQGTTNISAAQGGIVGSTMMTVTSNPNFAGVLTQHNDSSRTGQNLTETALTPSSVNLNTMGKLFSQPVDGQIYAQPLYAPNVAIQGKGNHNVIFVATEGDSVYAFDADDNTGANSNPLWTASLIDTAHRATPGETTVHILTDLNSLCTDIVPQVGITSTPVVDPSTGTMYVEAKSKKADGTFVHRLHMLDITNGAEKSAGPMAITATVPGTSDGGATITFDPLRQLNRPGLLLQNGTVYIGYASHCEITPYHGWVFAYDALTLVLKAAYITTANGAQGQGGIWMSGAGLAADSSGNIFTATANGSLGPADVGDSILKLVLNGNTISLADYFTPFDQANLDAVNLGVGSGGVLLLPDQPGSHPHELVQGSKNGTIYLIDRDQMAIPHYCSSCSSSDTQIAQEIQNAGVAPWLFSVPAYWNNNVYFWGSNDVLKAYTLSNGLLGTTPSSSSATSLTFPGATPAISANGNTNGIVWAIDSTQYGAPGPVPGPAILHAFDATNVAHELWSSFEPPNDPDSAGNAVKFTVPTIANGKIYVGTSTEVDVFALVH